MNILITGVTGFIGNHLIQSLIKQGHSCRCLVRKTSDITSLKEHDVELFYGDVTNADSLKGIADGIDIVYHLAAMGHVSSTSDEAYRQFRMINAEGTENLIKECLEGSIQKFIHVSSTAAMGLIKKQIVDENTPLQPSTPYQKSKYESEQVVLSYWKTQGFPGVVLRPCMVYGIGGKGEFLKICRLVKYGVFPRAGLGKNLTPIVHVEDVIQGALLAGMKGKPGETYLITSRQSYEMKTIRNIIIHCLDIKRPYIYIPVFLMKLAAITIENVAKMTKSTPIVTLKIINSTVADRTFSIKKAEDYLGYIPKVDLEEGIRETIQWFKKKNYL